MAADAAAVHPRLAKLHRGVVNEITNLEIVRAVEDQRKPAEEFLRIFRTEVGDNSFHCYAGIDGAQAALGRHGFGKRFARIGFLEQGLPL